ncbi:MAG: nucleotide sugar dehydrogenase, partial [Candidatus Margulisbacteria bacterium]|nr:nucleotide sugar dehydrogenase [Candidatus Margulisiibacteriota bacterium]
MQALKKKIISKKAKIGVIGLGYVGLPLVKEFVSAGFNVTGIDIDKSKIKTLNQGKSYIKHIPDSVVKDFKKSGKWKPTSDFTELGKVDAIIICVPTPLNQHREPDLSHVISTAKIISKHLQNGQLIVLESTTYPGTTEEDVLPILAKNGFKAGQDFFLAFSPEREDPGNKKFGLKNMPKIVGGVTPACLKIADLLYSQIVSQTVLVSSPRVAEAAKLLENIYRAVNIALVNELKML